MKYIIGIFLAISLSGCSTIEKYWPRDHDSALVSAFVNIDMSLDNVKCSTKEGFDAVIEDADWLNRYATFRKDPQKDATKTLLENLRKAKAGNEAACKRWVNLSKISMKVIQKSWEGR